MDRVIIALDKVIFVFLLILIFSLPFSNALIEISAISSILLWILKRIIFVRFSKQSFFPSSFLNLPIFIYLLFLVISTILSSNISLSLRFFFRKTLEHIAIFFIIFDTFDSRDKIKTFFKVLLSSLILISLDCLIQYFTKFELLRHRIAVVDRIAGPFEFPDQFGNYLSTLFPIILVVSQYEIKNKFLKVLYYVLLASLVFNFLTNFSKGAISGLIFSLLFFYLFIKNKKILICILILFIICFFLLSPLHKNIVISSANLNGPSFTHRVDLWKRSWNMFICKPVFGLGLGTYMFNYDGFKGNIIPTSGEEGIWYAHNSYLQMMAETGAVGLLSFMLIICYLFKKVRKCLKINKDRFLHILLLGISSGLIAYLIQIIFDSTYYSLPNSTLFWYFLSINVAVINLIEKK